VAVQKVFFITESQKKERNTELYGFVFKGLEVFRYMDAGEK